MHSEIISKIIPNMEDQFKKIFFTFDLDWCSDIVLDYMLKILESYDVHATFFVTHPTLLLNRIRENPKFELGIHPNFNFLLAGDSRYGKTYKEVIDYFIAMVPEAKSVRSHSLTQSSGILNAFSEAGLTHECNLYLPPQILPKPHLHWNGKLIRVPHFFQDDIECINGWINLSVIRRMVELNCIKVFDIHPIHVFLNTENIKRYIDSTSIVNDHLKLTQLTNNKIFGTKDLLLELLDKSI